MVHGEEDDEAKQHEDAEDDEEEEEAAAAAKYGSYAELGLDPKDDWCDMMIAAISCCCKTKSQALVEVIRIKGQDRDQRYVVRKW